MIITNTQLHTATPTQVNTYTPYTHPCDYNYLATPEDLEAFELALDAEDEAWLQENVEEKDELQGSLFLDHDGTYLITLHDRIRYHTACALSSFTHKVLQENPDAPYLTQAPSDDPVMMEFIDAMEETIRLECALGIMDPWDDEIDPWN